MNIIMIIAALAVLPINKGEQIVSPQHIVAVQASSTEASGTLKLQSVGTYTTEAFETWNETNIVGAVTNVTVKNGWKTTVHPVTNDVLDVTLSSGKYSSVTNLYVPGGLLLASGSAFTNSVISVFTEN